MSLDTAPSLAVRAPDGASARILLDGAQVVSWIPAGAQDDRLFLSRRAESGPGLSARGGIPICFPQFGPFGALPQHGFARNVRWTVRQDAPHDAGTARLTLTHHDVAAQRPASEVAAWPHPFTAEVAVEVGGDALTVTLHVANTSTTPLTFTAALHPYFAVRDALAVQVEGLSGLTYRDALADGAMVREASAVLAIPGPLDRIYYGAPDVLVLREPHRAIRIEKTGFPDAVVWNPGATITASKRDFEPGDEARMVCVEAAVIGTPVVLAPGASWAGRQRMVAIAIN